MLSNEEKLGKQINKIDSNKKDGLEAEEIDRFLGNERKVKKLGKIMQEAFGDESEKLQEYKENVGKICERILEKSDTINLNQGKILFFYLKHFHNEDVGIGHDIIKTVIDGSKGNRFEEVTSNFEGNLNQGDEEESQDQQNIDNRFYSLPGVEEIKEAWEKSEKCRQLLEGTDLSLEDIQWLKEYKENGDLDSNLINKIDEKIGIESLKRCETILDSVDLLLEEELQWLKEYKESIDKDTGQELIDRIEERLRLEEVDHDILGEVYSEIHSNPLLNIENICPGLEEMTPNWDAIRGTIKLEDAEGGDSETYLSKVEEKVTASVTEDTISQYLQLPEGIPDEDKFYITNNFQSILIKHLLLHPGYKACWGLNPNGETSDLTLKNMVEENSLLESAYKKLDELNKNRELTFDKLKTEQKNQKLEEVLSENNHILFDLRLKGEINSCNQKKVGDVVAYIMNYCNRKHSGKLKEYVKNNSFINSVYQEYINAKRQAEEENRRVEEMKRVKEEVEKYINQAENVNIPKNIRNLFGGAVSFKIFSRRQIVDFKDYYEKAKVKRQNNESYDYFCKLYESSKSFYESDWIKGLALPDSLRAQDYIHFVGCLQNMEDNINKVEREAVQAGNKRGFIPGNTGFGAGMFGEASYYEGKKLAKRVDVVRKYVELWKNSEQPNKPDNFLGVPLNWRYSEVDDIIRDSAFEGLRDKARTFGRDATGGRCFQQVVGDVVGLAGGLAASLAVGAASRGNPALSGAAYYLGNKLGNGVAQVGWDFVVDGLGKRVLGLGKESGSNKYDGVVDSFRIGIGQGKRDENGNVVDAKSRGEWAIDTAFGTAATAATFGITSKLGITIKESPFKYASIDEFINKPLSNTVAAASKAAIGTQNYEGISIGDAMVDQAKEEFGLVGIVKKLTNILVVTGMVKFANRWAKSDSDFVRKIDSKLERLESFLKSRGYKIENIQKMTEGEVKNIMRQGLSGVIDDLGQEVQKGWKAVAVPVIPLAMNGLLSSYDSPERILDKKVESVLVKKQKSSNDPKKIELYNSLLKRYNNLKGYIKSHMSNVDMDTGEMIDFMEKQGLNSSEGIKIETQPIGMAVDTELNTYGGQTGLNITNENGYITGAKSVDSGNGHVNESNLSYKKIYSGDAGLGTSREIVRELNDEISSELKHAIQKHEEETTSRSANNDEVKTMVGGILQKYNKKGKITNIKDVGSSSIPKPTTKNIHGDDEK